MVVGLAVLSLVGCPSPADTIGEDAVVPGTDARAAIAPSAPFDGTMSTRGSAGARTAALVRPVEALPSGEPILRDCDGSLGLNRIPRIGPLGLLSAVGCGSVGSEPPMDMEPVSVPQTVSAPAEAELEPPPPPEPAFVPRPAASPAASVEAGDNAARRTTTATPRPRPTAAKPAGGGGGAAEHSGPTLDRQSNARYNRDHRGDALDEYTRPVQRQPVATPTYEWGGTAYLSNDDSMSLASAQRVLWALSHGSPVDPFQVRKHELLNYFSFDTVDPPDGRVFGVLGGAEQDGDTLKVALAVRGANPQREPLDLTVVIDRSGSMNGEGKMNFTRRGLHQMVAGLQRGDRIDIVLFDNEVCTPVEGFVMGRDPVQVLNQVIDNIQPRGATDLAAGLAEAYRIQTGRDAADVHGRDRRVLVVTDAVLNSGNVDEALVAQVGAQLDQHDIHLSGVGVGSDFNDRMLDRLTEKGRGAYVFLGSEAVVDRVFGVGFDSLVRTVANDVHFALDLPPSLAMAKFYGEESSSVAADVKPVNFHAGTTQLFLQDLAIKNGNLVPSDPITMRITFRDAITDEPVTEELRTTVGALLDADRHNVRKAQALMAFADWTMAGASGTACGAPLSTFRQRAVRVGDDAEIAYVDSLVARQCGAAPMPAAVAAVELKVKLDSDVPVSAVRVNCDGNALHKALSGADTVARFDVTPGQCRVELEAAMPMTTMVTVPETGAEVWCRVRGGRMQCG